MRVLLVGAGAIGGYFGGRLAQGGAELSVVARSDYETVARNGYRVRSIAGDFEFTPRKVYRSAAEAGKNFDCILLSTKVLPSIDPVALIRDAVVPGKTVILLIQNGIGIEDSLARAFPENEILSGVAYIGVTKKAPGVIVHDGGGSLTIGEYQGKESLVAEELGALFARTPVRIQVTKNIQYHRWEKLLWNLPFNSVSVLGNGLMTNEMTDNGEVEKLCRELMGEVLLVAASYGIELKASLIEDKIEYTRNFPPYATSMLVDFRAHRPLESEAIVGNVCRLGRAHQLAIPRIETIYALLNAVNR